MGITSLRIRTDKKEYSVYEEARKTLKVRLICSPQAEQGEEATINLHRKGYEIYSWRQNLSNSVVTETSVDLSTLRDQETNAVLMQAGKYTVVATVGDLTATAEFYVAIVTVEELRSVWCKGATLLDAEILMPRSQPKKIQGVTVLEVSAGTRPGLHTLVYDVNEQALSWSDGEKVPIGDGDMVVLMNDVEEDYIVVNVYDELLQKTYDETILNGHLIAERLVIDYKTASDDQLRNLVTMATNWVEGQIHCPVEPRTVATERYDGEEVDEIADGVSYERPMTQGNWFIIELPYRMVLKVDRLEGYFNRSKITTVDRSWISMDKKTGQIELVPSNSAMINWILYGPTFAHYLYGYQWIPEFWHFKLTYGLQDLATGSRAVVREAIAKKAALDLLVVAGQAYKAGYSSESTSRDGISDSQSYTASAVYGIYSATTDEYKKWLYKNVQNGSLKRKLIGYEMTVL